MCDLSKEVIDDILKNGRIYEVGGVVRDRLLYNRTLSKDRDYLVTGIPFDKLSSILKNYGRVDLVGQSFGVIKFTQYKKDHQYTFDITLPRKEYSTGVGHKDFDVAFDPALGAREDLTRRDFTINAMALDLDNNELIDPLNGKADLENRRLRMVSDNSFEEDPLRMLRAIQFAARFQFEIEPATFKALKENASLMKTISPERIAEEFNKLLTLAEKPSDGFRLMRETGLMELILPELAPTVGVDQPGGYHAYDVFEHTLKVMDACPPKLRLRMAALFHDIRKPQAKALTETGATFYGHEVTGAKTARKVLNRLRYSKDFIDDVSTLVERHMFTTEVTDKGLRRLIRKVGIHLIFDLLDLRRADVVGQGMGGTTGDVDEIETRIRDELDRKPPFSRSDLALNGEDIMKMFNFEPSPEVGEILDYLMEAVLDNPEDNTEQKLEILAKKYFRNNFASDRGNDL